MPLKTKKQFTNRLLDKKGRAVVAWCGGGGDHDDNDDDEDDSESKARGQLVGIDLTKHLAIVREGEEGHMGGRYLRRWGEAPTVTFEHAIRLAERAHAYPNSVNWTGATDDVTQDIIALSLGNCNEQQKISVVDRAHTCQEEPVSCRVPLHILMQQEPEEDQPAQPAN